MGEVIPLRPEFAIETRAEQPSTAPISFGQEIPLDSERRKLRNVFRVPQELLEAQHSLPCNRLANLRAEIEAELKPAGRDAAARIVRGLSKTMKIPGEEIIGDWQAFTEAMIGVLEDYSVRVLKVVASDILRKHEWFPAIAIIVERCEAETRQRKMDLAGIDKMIAAWDRIPLLPED
jgi:hypothetical protein